MGIDSKNGAGITRAWKLNSQEFISYSRQLLSDQKRYNTELFDATKWQHCEVVFCEGFRAKLNPWFKDLPFSPAQEMYSGFSQIIASMRVTEPGTSPRSNPAKLLLVQPGT